MTIYIDDASIAALAWNSTKPFKGCLCTKKKVPGNIARWKLTNNVTCQGMVARSEMDSTGQTAAMSMMRSPQTAKMKTGRGCTVTVVSLLVLFSCRYVENRGDRPMQQTHSWEEEKEEAQGYSTRIRGYAMRPNTAFSIPSWAGF